MAYFADRLDEILEAAQAGASTDPIVIDPNDQESAMKALHRTRGPCFGWEAYKAGKDYEPPYVWDTANEESTHQARTGSAVRIKSPAIPIGPQASAKHPHAAKHGGVRPWSPDEVLRVLLYRSKDPSRRGLIWDIALKGAVRKAFQASGQAYDPESVIGLAASAAWRGLMKDQARPGTKFTSFIGMYIEEAATSGSPAGFGDEYKKSRGTLSRWQKAARAAARGLDLIARSTDPTTGQTIDPDMAQQGQQVANTALEEIQAEYDSMDSKPGPNNPYGNLVTKLLQVGGDLIAAIQDGNAERVMQSETFLGEVYDEISDQESRYRERGPSTDTLITKSKTAAPLIVGPLAVQKKGSDQETEVSNVATPGIVPGSKALGTWAFRWEEGGGGKQRAKERTKNVNNPIGFLQTHMGMSYEEARGLVSQKQDIPVRAAGGQPPGTLVFVPSNPGSDYAPGEASIRNDPQKMEALMAIVHTARMGTGSGKGRQAAAARQVIRTLKQVTRRAHDPVPPRRYTIQQQSGSYDVMSDTDGWWVYDVAKMENDETATDEDVKLAGPYATELRADQEKQKLMQTAKDYQIIDTHSGQVVDSHEIASDAKSQVELLNANPLVLTVDKMVHSLSQHEYGEYAAEIAGVGRQLLGALRTRDLADLPDIQAELDALDEVAAGDEEEPGVTKIKPLTSQQYRIFLRIYGISDYPEKGTVDDPEMDENGTLSLWARKGCPPVESNKELSDELKISTTRVSQHRKVIAAAMEKMIDQLQLRKEDVDAVDWEILCELRKAFQSVFLEYVQIHGRDAIFEGCDFSE
jgi:hypothetical protein